MHNSESFWASVDRPPCDERHACLIEVINEWDKEVDGDLARYLSGDKECPAWLCRGLTAGYKAWRMETRRLNRVEYVEDTKGGRVESDVMQKWIDKHYRSSFGNGCGFAEFSRLLDEHPV